MLATFLAVLGALLCWTIISEGLMFLLQVLALKRVQQQRRSAKPASGIFNLVPHSGADYAPYYQGYPTNSGNAEGKDGYGSGQYL